MSVIRIMDSGDDGRVHIRLHLPHSNRVQQSGFETEFPQEPGFGQGLGKKRLGPEDLHPPLLPEPELQFPLIGQTPVQLQAGVREVSKNGNPLSHGCLSTGLLKPPEPAHQVEVDTRLDVEGADRVQQPAESLAQHSRSGQRDRVAGDDQPGVPVGTPGADLSPFDQGDGASPLRQEVSGADADDAAADDENVRFLRHLPFALDFGFNARATYTGDGSVTRPVDEERGKTGRPRTGVD